MPQYLDLVATRDTFFAGRKIPKGYNLLRIKARSPYPVDVGRWVTVKALAPGDRARLAGREWTVTESVNPAPEGVQVNQPMTVDEAKAIAKALCRGWTHWKIMDVTEQIPPGGGPIPMEDQERAQLQAEIAHLRDMLTSAAEREAKALERIAVLQTSVDNLSSEAVLAADNRSADDGDSAVAHAE